jgi:hypothetical protein
MPASTILSHDEAGGMMCDGIRARRLYRKGLTQTFYSAVHLTACTLSALSGASFATGLLDLLEA